MTLNLIEFVRIANEDDIYSYFFKVFSSGKEREINIKTCDNKEIDWSCSCAFGSSWRYSKKNIEDDTKCKHYDFCIALLKYLKEII